jgi:hypothetical protein
MACRYQLQHAHDGNKYENAVLPGADDFQIDP